MLSSGRETELTAPVLGETLVGEHGPVSARGCADDNMLREQRGALPVVAMGTGG